MKNCTMLLVDSHKIYRESLSLVLNAIPEITVIGECATAKEAVELSTAFLPDIVILDMNLPDQKGVEAIKAIKAAALNCKILAVFNYINPLQAEIALQKGADAVLAKLSPFSAFLDAITATLNGKQFLCEELKYKRN